MSNGKSSAEIQLDNIRKNRVWYLLLGGAMIVLGLVALATPWVATLAFTTLVGWVLLAGGVIQAIQALRSKGGSHLLASLLVAVLFAGVGIWMLTHPLQGAMTLALLLAGFFIAEGIMKIISGIKMRPALGWSWWVITGIASLILGAILWSGLSGTALWTIGLLLGIDLIIGGWSSIMLALAVAKDARS